MKKKISLALVLVMIVGALFGVIPMAEGDSGASAETTGRYVPEIAYANVNYVDSVYMMFAVPVAELGEGESIELLVWDSRIESKAFSYYDIIKTVIEPETAKATIGGVEHYVFKYNGLYANDMTKNVCARPVLVKDGVALSYGKLVEYSVREYVESAKGNIYGIDGVSDESVIKSLDSMLAFGSLAQKFSSKKYSFLADEEVRSIYVTSIVNGIDKGKTFAGFFKYEEGGTATIDAPYIDGTNIEKITDADGNIVEDINEFIDGYQIEVTDANIELVVYYRNAVARSFNAEIFGEGMAVNNYDDVVGGNNLATKDSNGYTIHFKDYGKANLSGVAATIDSYKRMNYWHSIKTVYDPDDPDNLVFMLTATNKPALQFANVTPGDFSGIGFGDTIYPAFTFEMSLGAINGKMPTTGYYYFRHRFQAEGTNYADLNIFQIVNGEVMLAGGESVGKIPETGMRRFAITVDALTGAIYGYAEDESGAMVQTVSGEVVPQQYYINRANKHLENLADDDPTNDETLAMYENVYTFFTKSAKLEPSWQFGNGANTNAAFENSSIEINGVDAPILAGTDADGNKIFNMEAVKALAERDHSFLLDDFNLVMGYVYE